MKILGWLFIGVGFLFCLSLIGYFLGVPMIGVGAVLLIVSAITRRQKALEELAQQAREYRGYDRGQDVDPQATQRARIANSQFGR
jgi:hypothetical protein